MANTALNVVRLVGVILESVGYGVYLVTSLSYFSASCHSRRVPSLSSTVKATVGVVLFVIATTHLGLNCYRVAQTLAIDAELNRDLIPSLALSDIQSWDNIMGSVLIVVQCTIGDAIPIYRCFIVYDRSWKIIAPSVILYLGGCACTAYFISLQSSLSVNLINVKILAPLGTAFWALTLVQNTLSTSLLIFRIWRVSHRFRSIGNLRSSSRSLDAAAKIIAASGSLYTLIAFLNFVAAACGSLAGYPLSDLAVVVVGIAFNLLVTRSAKIFEPSTGTSNEETATTTHTENDDSAQFQFTSINLSRLSSSKRQDSLGSSDLWTQGSAPPGMIRKEVKQNSKQSFGTV